MISPYNYNKFDIGQKVVCIDNTDTPLELHKVYTIKKEMNHILSNSVELKETGHTLFKSRFISLKEYRKQKLNKIL